MKITLKTHFVMLNQEKMVVLLGKVTLSALLPKEMLVLMMEEIRLPVVSGEMLKKQKNFKINQIILLSLQTTIATKILMIRLVHK